MANSCEPKPLNPNAKPWLNLLPHQLYHNSSLSVVPYYSSPVTVVPVYSPPATVVPVYSSLPTLVPVYHFYPLVPDTVQPPPSQCVVPSACPGGRSSVLRKRRCNTTVMIRNIPNRFRRSMLVDFLDQVCDDQNARHKLNRPRFAYDFLYLPFDFKSGDNLGYAFVNFTTPFAADKIWDILSGYKWRNYEDIKGQMWESKKICEINWADIQGKKELVEHFKHSKFVCTNIDYLPVLFSPPRDGAISSFPPTTVGKLLARHSTSY